jgi:hypothetical protein
MILSHSRASLPVCHEVDSYFNKADGAAWCFAESMHLLVELYNDQELHYLCQLVLLA